MSDITIIHLLEKRFPNGAYTMLEELHWAIDFYHSEIKQKILICGSSKDNPDFLLPCEQVNIKNLLDVCQKSGPRVVVLFHKLMKSRIPLYGKVLFGKVPFIVVNHTQSKIVNGMGSCDYLVSVSEYMKKENEKAFPNMRHVFIRNGVNQSRFDNVKPLTDFGDDGLFRTGRMNAFNHHKYNDEFVKWIGGTKWAKPMVHEYLGSGHFQKQAGRIAKNMHKHTDNRVRIRGPVYNFSRKISILKSWELFVYNINQHEGTSMSILESLACGVPVICSNHFGNKEIIEQGVNGYVFKNLERAAEIINNLMTHPDELANLKATTKKHFADNLDAKYTAQKYVELIYSCLSEKGL